MHLLPEERNPDAKAFFTRPVAFEQENEGLKAEEPLRNQ